MRYASYVQQYKDSRKTNSLTHQTETFFARSNRRLTFDYCVAWWNTLHYPPNITNITALDTSTAVEPTMLQKIHIHTFCWLIRHPPPLPKNKGQPPCTFPSRMPGTNLGRRIGWCLFVVCFAFNRVWLFILCCLTTVLYSSVPCVSLLLRPHFFRLPPALFTFHYVRFYLRTWVRMSIHSYVYTMYLYIISHIYNWRIYDY